MAWGAAIGAIGGALISSQSADDQADAMEGATEEQIDFMREKFDYTRSLQEALIEAQAPRREAAQRATRSLSMMAGLGDPGGTGTGGGTGGSILDKMKLRRMKNRLAETDKYTTEFDTGDYVRASTPGGDQWYKKEDTYVTGTGTRVPRRDARGLSNAGMLAGTSENQRVTQEWKDLNSQIESLEKELAGGSGEGGEAAAGDDFQGPTDVTEMPGYDFAVEQGLESLAASGAARGMQLSGNQMEDITEFGQGTAMKFRGQLIDQLAQVAGMRPSGAATQNLASSVNRQAQAVSPLIGQMGQIGAARTAGQYGAVGSAFANMPWGQMFNNQTANTTTGGGGVYGGTTSSGATLAVPSGGGRTF